MRMGREVLGFVEREAMKDAGRWESNQQTAGSMITHQPQGPGPDLSPKD